MIMPIRPRLTTIKGLVPESWACIDCGINTSPGNFTREHFDEVFNSAVIRITEDHVEITFGELSEVYTVRDAIWTAAGMAYHDGCLCIGCLEARLGRRLSPRSYQLIWQENKDRFGNVAKTKHDPLNKLPGTARLLSRQGRQ